MYFRLVRSPEHFQTAAKHGRRKTLERRASMQRTVRIATFGIALAILFLLGTVPRAQAQDHSCSNATLDGSFGFSGTGTVFNCAYQKLRLILQRLLPAECNNVTSLSSRATP